MTVVNIPDPCSRTPESMNSVKGGFYCDDCRKVVVDFREKTNEEILAELSSKSRKVCGIFNKSQASRGPKPTFELARFAAAVVLAFGSFLFMTTGTGCSTAGEPIDDRTAAQIKADSIADARMQFLHDSALVGDSIAAVKTDSIPDIDTGIIYTSNR